MNEAFFGGTFDPIHIGHVWIAQQVCEDLNLDRVNIVPNYSKASEKWNKKVIASNEQRLKMCKLATKDFKKLSVCSWEIESKSLYTYLSVLHFHSDNKVKWIVGLDWLNKLKTFKKYETLEKLCEFIVVDRPKVNDLTVDLKKAIIYKPEVNFQLSSTYIRQRIKNNLPITGLVHKDVERFIKKESIYESK